jgi:hypothetical protein
MRFGAVVEAALSPNSRLSSMAIRKRLGNMLPADRSGAGEIGNCACNSQNARPAATGEPESMHRLLDQLCRIGCEEDGVALDLRITRWPGGSVAGTYRQSGTFDPFRNHGA